MQKDLLDEGGDIPEKLFLFPIRYIAEIVGLGANLRYMGYFLFSLHPPGRKTWLLS